MSLIHILAQVAVASAPPAATQGVTAYPPEFFAAARPANAREMLDRVPGFAFDGGDSVRGYEGAAGNVLVDGQRPATKTDSLDELLRRIPFTKVARVELIRGGAPGVDMQGKSILANIVLKTGDSFHGLAAISDNWVADDGRHAIAGRLEASGKSGDRAWEFGFFGGRGIDDGSGDGPRLRAGPSGTPLIRSLVQSEGSGVNWILTGAYEQPLLGGQLRVNVRYLDNPYDYDETNRSSFPADSVERDHQSDDVDTTEVGLRYSRDLGPRTKLELVGLRQTKDELFGDIDRAPASTQDFSQHSQTEEIIGRGVVKFTQTPKLSWEAGGESVLNTLDNTIRFLQDGAPVVLPAANVHVEEKRWEVFGKAVWRPGPKWTVEAAIREEGSDISSTGDVVLAKTLTYAKPRLAVTWAADPATQFHVIFERTVGQLDFNDFVASSSLSKGVLTAGNPNLVPEQAWVTEAGVERSFWDGGDLSLSLRHSALTGAIDRAPVFAPSGVFDAPANIGDGTKDELIVGLTLPFDKLGLKGAQLHALSTWRDTEVTDPTTHVKRELSKLHPLDWEAHFTWDLPQYSLNWGIDAFGAWREAYYRSTEVELRKLKTYVTPFIEWKPRPDLSLRAEFGNVTERGFRDTRYVYAGPRGANGLAYVEDRNIEFGRMYYLRFRKTFD